MQVCTSATHVGKLELSTLTKIDLVKVVSVTKQQFGLAQVLGSCSTELCR